MKKSLQKKIRYIISLTAIVIGIGVILKPWYHAYRFDRMQKRAMKMWYSMDSSEIDSRNEGDSLLRNNSGTWSSSVAVIGGGDGMDNEIWEEDINPAFNNAYIQSIMDGILTIEKISLKVPILKNLTTEHLNISICSVIETNYMGQTGNYVLAGHKSRIYGRHFNRLLELVMGDIIVVENEREAFEYQITDIFSVTPSDEWVMQNDGNKKMITLITCDYRTEPVGRLIVRGELINGT